MTKLTALDLYILTDTVLHSLAFKGSWTGSATEEARGDVIKKLQKIMSGMEMDLSEEVSEEENDRRFKEALALIKGITHDQLVDLMGEEWLEEFHKVAQ